VRLRHHHQRRKQGVLVSFSCRLRYAVPRPSACQGRTEKGGRGIVAWGGAILVLATRSEMDDACLSWLLLALAGMSVAFCEDHKCALN